MVIFILVLLGWLTTSTGLAKPVDSIQAENAVRGWLKRDTKPFKAKLHKNFKNVQTFSNANNQPIYHVVYVEPDGFIILSADDMIEPIIAYVDSGTFDPSLDNPLGALINQDLNGRIAAIRNLPALPLANAGFETTTSEITALQNAAATAQDKWQRLTLLGDNSNEQIPLTGEASITDVRVGEFIKSRWDQATICGSTSCYNYYTPPGAAGASDNYPAGCVATMMAQMMWFYKYPTAGIGQLQFTIYVDGNSQTAYTRGGDGSGGAYNWAEMPLIPDCGTTESERQAIGAICYDTGIAVNMYYTSSISVSYIDDAKTAIVTTFGYNSAVIGGDQYNNIGSGLTEMLNPNLDAGYPVLLGINNGSTGHAVVCDGYGYNSQTIYHHLNMGWSGYDNAWYNLPTIIGTYADYTSIHACVYNIYVSDSGEIISGRILDSLGQPLDSVTISAEKTGGGIYNTTTDSNGIYALTALPSASTYTISPILAGYSFESQIVSTGTSSDGSFTSGNKWQIDFTGTPIDIITDLNGDFITDLADFRIFSNYWLDENCIDPNWCQAADIDHSGEVDHGDLMRLVQKWLEAIEIEESFISTASHDGRVYDNNDGTGAGNNSNDNAGSALRLGDFSGKQGFRSILSFDTSPLPADCKIISATLELTRGDDYGTDPFGWGGQCLIDVNSNCLGTDANLENYDWQAPANAVAVAGFSQDPCQTNPMVSTEFDANGLNNINIDGLTQVRVYFTNSNNNDGVTDFLGFYSGDYTIANRRPKLTIRYNSRIPVVKLSSIAAEDGRVWDNDDGTGNDSNAGDADDKALRLGDHSGRQSYRTILSFDTSSLPAGCNIISARLELTRGAQYGSDPFGWGGPCLIDVNSLYIGTGAALENYDWQAPADANAVAGFSHDPGREQTMVSSDFNENGRNSINKNGKTQIKVYMTNPTNNNSTIDFLGFYSGEYTSEDSKRPKLIIRYTAN